MRVWLAITARCFVRAVVSINTYKLVSAVFSAPPPQCVETIYVDWRR